MLQDQCFVKQVISSLIPLLRAKTEPPNGRLPAIDVYSRGPGRIPRVHREIRSLDIRLHLEAKDPERIDVQMHVDWRIPSQVVRSQLKQAGRRSGPSAVLGVIGAQTLFLKMHKCASDLDKAFEEMVICMGRTDTRGASVAPILLPQPEILQHVVGFIIKLLVEALEESDVTRIHIRVARCPKACDKFRDSLVFIHM